VALCLLLVSALALGIPRHYVDISGIDVTELYMTINSPRSPWQCLKSAWPYLLLQFWRYRGKSGLGAFYPLSCRVRVKQSESCMLGVTVRSRSSVRWLYRSTWNIHCNVSCSMNQSIRCNSAHPNCMYLTLTVSTNRFHSAGADVLGWEKGFAM